MLIGLWVIYISTSWIPIDRSIFFNFSISNSISLSVLTKHGRNSTCNNLDREESVVKIELFFCGSASKKVNKNTVEMYVAKPFGSEAARKHLFPQGIYLGLFQIFSQQPINNPSQPDYSANNKLLPRIWHRFYSKTVPGRILGRRLL